MSTIRIRTRIESETLQLPELRRLIGKDVHITIDEAPADARSERSWQALIDAAGKDLIDPEVYRQYREFDRQHQATPEL